MQLLDLTLDTPAENVAIDEALLDAAEADPRSHGEVLRLWEPSEMMVIVGSSSRMADEVDLDACAKQGIPVLRRCSGGAAILTGPGCLMYAVVLSYQQRPQLKPIDQAHQFVLDTIAGALNKKNPDVSVPASVIWSSATKNSPATACAASATIFFIMARCCTASHWKRLANF